MPISNTFQMFLDVLAHGLGLASGHEGGRKEEGA